MRTLFFVLLIALAGCKGQQATVKPTFKHFIIGQGGGFTGKYTEFKLHQNGTVEQKNFGAGIYEPYATMEKEAVTSFFNELAQLQLTNYTFNHPGNMTWYLEMPHNDELHTVKWGDHNHPVRADVKAFYDKVNLYVRGLKQ